MDTKKVKALLAALEKGSLTAAAEEMGYTQSGLTHMMNSLEDELGIRILVRSKGGVRLSPAGRELLPQMNARSLYLAGMLAFAAANNPRRMAAASTQTGAAIRCCASARIPAFRASGCPRYWRSCAARARISTC